MSSAYGQTADVDTVSDPVAPLYFTQVEVAGVPVKAMVDPGGSGTWFSPAESSLILIRRRL